MTGFSVMVGMAVPEMWDPHPFIYPPLFWDRTSSPEDSQDSPQMQQEFGTVLIHFIWCATRSRSRTCPCFADNIPASLLAAVLSCRTAPLVEGGQWGLIDGLTDSGILNADIIIVWIRESRESINWLIFKMQKKKQGTWRCRKWILPIFYFVLPQK